MVIKQGEKELAARASRREWPVLYKRRNAADDTFLPCPKGGPQTLQSGVAAHAIDGKLHLDLKRLGTS
jgi:hypothetical protein